jgi:UDP-glucose 4-epimerase
VYHALYLGLDFGCEFWEVFVKVLVTGAAGYIGSVTVERLLEAGHEVVALDNLWRGHEKALSGDIPFIQADIRDASATSAAVKSSGAEAVIHIAAATLVGESVENPLDYFAVNVVGSHNLIAATLESGIKRFVFSSTAAVYGVPKVIPVKESSPLNPINPYGLSKLIVEQMLEWHSRIYGLNYAAMRYFNVAGATEAHGEDHNPETHVIPVALTSLLDDQSLFRVFGTDYPTADGTAIRDYVHVIDLADAHVLALENLDRPLGPFNIGTREGFSVMEIVKSVEGVTDRTLKVELGDRRAGDPPVLIADSTRARQELGWNPTRSTLEDMIGSAWQWMQAHPNGYRAE